MASAQASDSAPMIQAERMELDLSDEQQLADPSMLADLKTMKETMHVHTLESLIWEASHADDLKQFLDTIKYVCSYTICSCVSPGELKGQPARILNRIIDWKAVHKTPLGLTMQRVVEKLIEDSATEFKKGLYTHRSDIGAL